MSLRTHLACLAAAAAAFLSMPACADQALAVSKNCMACHAVDKRVVGPAFQEVARRYAGNPAAEEKLVKKVMVGGSGAWGVVPMPANTQVNEAEARKLVSWALNLH